MSVGVGLRRVSRKVVNEMGILPWPERWPWPLF